MCIQSKDEFEMQFEPEVKYTKFNFYSKVSIFRYIETKKEVKVILSINSKTHRNIHFIFYKDSLKQNVFNTINHLLNDSIFNDAKEFLQDF